MTGRLRPDRRRDRGAALILVLWGTVVMSIVAAAATREAALSAATVNAGAELTRARSLADGGIRAGWTAFSNGAVDPETGQWSCRIAEGAMFVTVRPERAKADLNGASEQLLAALFRAAGANADDAVRFAAMAIDYRDSDQDKRPDGAEAGDYAAAGLPWRARNGAFETIEELAYLPRMDEAVYRAILPNVTVHSRASDIEARFASPMMRAALADYERQLAGVLSEEVDEFVPPASPDAAADEATSFEGTLMSVRVVGVTNNNAVFVREAVVEGPFQPGGTPRIVRFAQGRLGEGEITPDPQNAPDCR